MSEAAITEASLGPRASRPHLYWHHRGYLPHFDNRALVQTVTFRLVDSLPRSVYEQIAADSAEDFERRRRLDAMLDEGRGDCLLRNPHFARTVACALEYFDGERYSLLAWVIMPNHVHVLIEQIEGFPLGDVVSSWKSFAAKAVNKLRGWRGTVWAPDYFDRFIRNERHFANAVSYIENNPVLAGLVTKPEDWGFSSAARRNAGGTPAVPG